MILTLTPDPVLDRIYIIEEWTPGIPARAHKASLSVGGKGLDASVALRHLGQETTALTFLAGRTGRELAELIEAYGIDLINVPVGGETRTALVVSEEKHNRHSHLFSGGITIDPEQAQTFINLFEENLPRSSWIICGGIIPADLPTNFFAQFIEKGATQGIPVLVDAFRDFMHGALPAQPEVVKMNWQEFEWTFEQQKVDLPTLYQQVQSVYQQYRLKNLVITCDVDGMLACTSEGLLRAVGPRLQALNAAGAGDAASGTIAWRRASGDSWEETLRWAAAVGGAVVLTEGTADCRPEDVQRLYRQIDITHIN